MRIIRFLDPDGRLHLGHDPRDGAAIRLEGDPLGGGGIGGLRDTGERVPVARPLCPIEPRAIFGVGLNYRDHARETGQPIPDAPVVFMKNPAAAVGPGEPIRLPPTFVERPEVDYEVELAVVLGAAACNVAEPDALGHVLGYTVGNDVSARRVQKHGGAGQWVKGKSYDTFCPLGPVLVTPDEIPDPQRLAMQTRLNGRVMQDSSTSQMIFGVARLISELSNHTTLLPGTVILTGTPAGVGFVRSPRVFLKPGDRLELEIESIGTLVSPVEAALSAAPPVWARRDEP